MNIILGSSSPSRKAVLETMGFTFITISPDIDERAIRRDDPRELVTAIAQAKMDAVLQKVDGDALVICSDQVMVVDAKIREKPENKEEAYAFIHGVSPGRISSDHSRGGSSTVVHLP